MKKSYCFSTLCITLAINGCTSDFKPESSASGEQIFQVACAECHQPLDENVPDVLFELHPKNMNVGFVKHKIYTGSIRMPKFPNIKGSKMQSLSTYVLAHSISK